ncbi:3478_t:CDS:2, partial [Acaulospora colombiana]
RQKAPWYGWPRDNINFGLRYGRPSCMAATGTPTSPFIHQSFMNISQRRAPHSRPETPGISYADFVKQWQDSHVARWLTDNKCAHQAQAFRENDIRGDIILELDMDILKEIGITSVGDRTRIRTAIKELRRLCSGSSSSFQTGPRVTLNGAHNDLRGSKSSGLAHKSENSLPQDNLDGAPVRNSRSRPPPLQIDNVREKDLPQIQRIDSARLTATPTPRAQTTNTRHAAPYGSSSNPSKINPSVSPLATKTRLGVPGPGAQRVRTPTGEPSHPPPFTNDPLPPAPSVSPVSSWNTAPGLPRNPAPGNLPGGSFAPRATSPVPPNRSRLANQNPSAHTRQGSGTNRSYGSGSGHPYSSSSGASLAPGPVNSHILSPVSENFTSGGGYSVGRGPFKSSQAQGLKDDEVRRKLIKFHFGESNSRVLEFKDSEDAAELVERALKKFGVQTVESQPPIDDILAVGGWGVYLGSDTEALPLSEDQLMALIHDPDHQGRDYLYLKPLSSGRPSKLERIFGEAPPMGPTSPIEESLNALTANRLGNKKLNRASTVSVL